MQTVLETSGLKISFPNQELVFPDFTLSKSESSLLIGPSGVGKSTLIQILSGLQQPGCGYVTILGQDLYKLSLRKRDLFRAKHIGLALQQSIFVPSISVVDNLLLASSVLKSSSNISRKDILSQLDKFGILTLSNKLPEQLSAGEKQRVNFLRACINSPALLLVDEPTANLDDENTSKVCSLLKELSGAHETAMMVVSHDARLKREFPNSIAL